MLSELKGSLLGSSEVKKGERDAASGALVGGFRGHRGSLRGQITTSEQCKHRELALHSPYFLFSLKKELIRCRKASTSQQHCAVNKNRTFQTNIHVNEFGVIQILTKEFQCGYMHTQMEEHTLMCFKSEILSVDINS